MEKDTVPWKYQSAAVDFSITGNYRKALQTWDMQGANKAILSANDSLYFNKFRGTDWMKEPCRSCSEKENDLGGCRCQAMLLAGDAESADPVCSKSPNRHLIDQAIKDTENPGLEAKPIMFRSNKNSKNISEGEEKERVAKVNALP